MDGSRASARPSAVRRRAAAARASLSSAAPLFAQLCPVLQPLSDLALEAALGRIVKFLPAQLFRKIILAGKCAFRVVIVFVAGTITLILHQLGRRIEDALWRQQRTGLLGRALRGAEGRVGRVRFRCGRHIDHGLRKREFALWAS